jgi:hypothetical protein
MAMEAGESLIRKLMGSVSKLTMFGWLKIQYYLNNVGKCIKIVRIVNSYFMGIRAAGIKP